MKKTTMTIKKIVESFPARLGIDPSTVDLSTPENALDFLNGEACQTFANIDDMADIWDGYYEGGLVIEADHKTMYDINGLFSELSENRKDLQKKYDYFDEVFFDGSVVDEDGNIEYGVIYENDQLDTVITENNWKYRVQFDDDFNGFDRFIEALIKICIENKGTVSIIRFILDDHYKMTVNSEGEIEFGKNPYVINDDNGYGFVSSLLFYLNAFRCDSFEKLEKYGMKYEYIESNEKRDIPEECGLTFIHQHRDELASEKDIVKAVNIISKYPNVIVALPEELQQNNEVAKAFLTANNNILIAAKSDKTDWRTGRHMTLSCSLSRGEIAKYNLNGIVYTDADFGAGITLDSKIVQKWAESPELLDILMRSEMWSWLKLSDEMYSKFNHKELIKEYPQYVYCLRRYFFDSFSKAENGKLAEHIRRRFEMNNHSTAMETATMAVYEVLLDIDKSFLPVLINSYDSFILAEYVSDWLRTLSEEKRDKVIMSNMKYAYYIREELYNDEPIVDYIVDQCPRAGDILSDEIVIKRGLKRTVLDEELICENCDLC